MVEARKKFSDVLDKLDPDELHLINKSMVIAGSVEKSKNRLDNWIELINTNRNLLEKRQPRLQGADLARCQRTLRQLDNQIEILSMAASGGDKRVSG